MSIRNRVRFMGGPSRQWWWDVRCFGGWCVVQAGYFNRPRRPRIYWSPNGTEWHHDARRVIGRAPDRECVCSPECKARTFGAGGTYAPPVSDEPTKEKP